MLINPDVVLGERRLCISFEEIKVGQENTMRQNVFDLTAKQTTTNLNVAERKQSFAVRRIVVGRVFDC